MQCLIALLIIFFIGIISYFIYEGRKNSQTTPTEDFDSEVIDIQSELVKDEHDEFIVPEGEYLEKIEEQTFEEGETTVVENTTPKRKSKRNYKRSSKQKKG